MRVTFLGTGSASPSKYRNGSAIWLDIPRGRVGASSNSGDCNSAYNHNSIAILLDVAEGTACQLFQHCGCDLPTFDKTLLTLRIVWISHAHADHLCGFPALVESLFQARFRESKRLRQQNVNEVRILVFAPAAVLSYYRYCLEVAGLEDVVRLVDIQVSRFAGDHVEVKKASHGRVSCLVSVPVLHCKHAYGAVISLQLPDPQGIGEGRSLKIVYSGDCRPSQSLVAAGKNCDLLIHEATFADSRLADAKKKLHCTRSEAIHVSSVMRAKFTTLTHFSQRYPVSQAEEQSEREEEKFVSNGSTPQYAVTFDFCPSASQHKQPFSHQSPTALRRC